MHLKPLAQPLKARSAFSLFVALHWLGFLLIFLLPVHAQSPRRGGTLRLAIVSDLRTLDSAQLFSGDEGMLAQLVYNSLLDYTADGRFIPGLAESLPEMSPDGLQLKFKLRPGRRFANGRLLTAADVVYSIERYLNPAEGAIGGFFFRSLRGAAAFESARRKEMAEPETRRPGAGRRWIEPVSVAGVKALDELTVQFELEQPDLLFLHVLTMPGSAILPREEIERWGARFGTHPVGTGPFVLKEWKRGVRMRFERNPHYFMPGQPYLDAIEVAIGVDFTTQAMMFERGELDLQMSLTDPDYLRFRKDPKLSPLIKRLPGVLPNYVAMNCELPPFTNRLVRVALNHAVDKAAILKALSHRGVIARGPLAPSVKGFNGGLPEYRHDPARARMLLAEAGFPHGFETSLMVKREDAGFMKIALIVQQNLREVGVTAQLREVSGSAFNDLTQRRGQVPMSVGDWGATFDDPRDTLDLLNGELIADEASMNTAFHSHPDLDALFRRAAREPDAERRLRLYQQVEEGIVREAPWIFLLHLNLEQVRQPWLHGFQLRPIWPNARLEQCWLER
jgi:ABC-type transport system substrate-binding protein